MATKRKKVNLTILEKLILIKKFENGDSLNDLSSQFGIINSTVRDILRQKNKLMQYASVLDSSTIAIRHFIKTSELAELNAIRLIPRVSQVKSE